MSKKSTIGKQAWRDRAPGYAGELRADIEREASARFANWQARGREPLWIRLKRRLRAGTLNARVRSRS